MSANTSADTSAHSAAAAPPAPPSPGPGAAAHMPRRSGLLLGAAALAVAGVSAVAFAPTLAELRAHLVGMVPAAGEAPAQAPPGTVAAPQPPPAPAAVAGAGGPVPPAASDDPGDPWAELRALMEEARSPVPGAEVRGMTDERAERQRLAAALRDLGLLVRQGLEGQIQLRKEIARLEAENRAATEGVQSRVDTLQTRVAFAADARVAAAPVVPLPQPAATAAGPGAPQQQAQPAPQQPRMPWQTPGHVPVRSLRSPAAAYQVGDASADMALLLAPKPAPGQPPSVVVRVGTEVPGLGRVTKIERRTTGWEVHTERGVVTE